MSEGLLEGKVAIVTGAGQGLGREHALALAKAGASVVVNDLDVALDGGRVGGDSAQRVVDEIEAGGGRAVANGGDIADGEAAAALVAVATDAFGRLDILVNNAGILRDRMIVNMTEDEWDAVIRVHMRGHFCPTHHAARYWRGRSKSERGTHGRIINTSSPSGVFGMVGQFNYGAAKAAISAMTTISALELGRYGVTVNAIAPSARTRMTDSAFGEIDAGDSTFDPMNPANVSPVVVALSADEADAITGQTFLVWGGLVSVLRPWDLGEVLGEDVPWDARQLLETLSESYPNGLLPEAPPQILNRFRGGRSRTG